MLSNLFKIGIQFWYCIANVLVKFKQILRYGSVIIYKKVKNLKMYVVKYGEQ